MYPVWDCDQPVKEVVEMGNIARVPLIVPHTTTTTTTTVMVTTTCGITTSTGYVLVLGTEILEEVNFDIFTTQSSKVTQ